MTQAGGPIECVDLLVVGAGPVGLFAGLCAARSGLKVLLIDQVWRGYGRGYATLLHANALTLLESVGLGERLRASGQRIDRVLLDIEATNVGSLELPRPALAVSQNALEEALLQELRAADVEVRAPQQAGTIEQHAGHVDVRVMRRELVTLGSPAHYSEWEPVDSTLVRAKFVIGADGYDSRVRAALGIESIDVGSSESFAIFEFPSRGEPAHHAQLSFHDGLASVLLPLGNGRTRASYQIRDQLHAEADLERLSTLLRERHVSLGDRPERVDFGTVMQFERRMARRFGKDRVWLAGDAAHITSPLGAQSLNVGLKEAHQLVQHCVAALARGDAASELASYAHACEREWHKLLGVNVRFDLAPDAPAWLGTYARRIVPALPAAGKDLAAILASVGLELR